MRRTWLRGHANILKCYLVPVAALNLGLVMRQMLGAGTPRGLAAMRALLRRLSGYAKSLEKRINDLLDDFAEYIATVLRASGLQLRDGLRLEMVPSSTAC